MRGVAELKEIFQDGWNDRARVENWIRHHDCSRDEGMSAWMSVLGPALPESRLRVLDVGTGAGFYAEVFARLGHESTGLDFSQEMLAAADRRIGSSLPNCRFVPGDAEQLPFEDARFDAVFSRLVIFNLPNPGRAVRDWLRVLKPGGRLILAGEEREKGGGRDRLSSGILRTLGWCLLQATGEPRGSGWDPSPDYLKAVKQLPMWNHHRETLRALMDGAGAVRIEDLPTAPVLEFRKAAGSLGRRLYAPPVRPFVWAGFRP